MNRIVFVLAVLALVMAIGVPQATAGTGDGNAYSFNWLRDADGDGIPNCLDEDWIRPMDGTGYRLGQGFGLLLGLCRGNTEDGNMHRNEYRHRRDQSGTGGDCIRDLRQNRDGSCK